jgi:hypothetical protein
MSNHAKSDSKIPEAWRAKFREWGSLGGRRGRREDKVRAARKSWAPGGGNYHRRKQPPQPSATAAQPNSDAEIQQAMQQISRA